jgi:hypothetical protein
MFFLTANAQAKSIIREGEPFISFEKLYAPEVIKQGQFFQISIDVTTKKNIWEDLGTFLHITSVTDNKILINNDFPLTIPSSQWAPGEIIKIGPANSYIPEDLPPGTYNIQLGFYLTKVSPSGTVYVREPYTNKEIKDFVIGQLKVETAQEEAAQKKEDLVLSNFETEEDLKKWEPTGTLLEQNTAIVAEGNYSAKIVYPKGSDCCPGITLGQFFNYSDPKYSDWTTYDILQFRIFGEKDEEGHTHVKYPVTLQVKDKNEKRYKFSIPPEQQNDAPLAINLSVIGKEVDLSNIGNLTFFVSGTPPDKDYVVYIDDLRLISLGIEKHKGPFVKFENLKVSPERVRPNEDINIEASFSISQKFTEDYTISMHLYRATDRAGMFDVNLSPIPPTTLWETNKVITQGRFKIHIPVNSPPGKYNIELALYLTRQMPPGALYVKYHRQNDGVYYITQPNYPQDYFKQPYVNYKEYGDWVVGSFEVTLP